jgi:hypothetical protein
MAPFLEFCAVRADRLKKLRQFDLVCSGCFLASVVHLRRRGSCSLRAACILLPSALNSLRLSCFPWGSAACRAFGLLEAPTGPGAARAALTQYYDWCAMGRTEGVAVPQLVDYHERYRRSHSELQWPVGLVNVRASRFVAALWRHQIQRLHPWKQTLPVAPRCLRHRRGN